jgi:diguanylate cyclase (GGDEF)-like protein
VRDAITTQLYRHLPADPEQQFRARLLLGILTTLIVANILVLAFFIVFAPAHMDPAAIRLAILSTAIALAVNVFSAALLLRGHLLLPASFVVAIEASAMWTIVWFTGGVPQSPALPLLLAPVVFAFCLLGPRLGVLLAAVTASIMWGQWYGVSHLGWVSPSLQSRRNPAFDSVLIATLNSFIVIAVLLVYEMITARLREQLLLQASHDDLTGVSNRREFMAQLAQGCARCNRSGQQLAVFYVDLNGFKQINDQLGHQTGDRVLKVVAARLRGTLRLQDIVARLGGDEFAVVTEPRPGADDLATMQRKLRETIREPVIVGGHSLSVDASIGVALYPSDGASPEALLRHADAAMYRDKKGA